jgi:hypothetical protein
VILLQVVVPSVKVNVTPALAATPVTNPAFVTVAFVASLLAHVPPLVGVTFMVQPIHKPADGVLTTGNTFITTELVVLLRVVVLSVKVNVTPTLAATPVTNPAFVTVAFVASLLTHVPPLFGVRFMVLPIHKPADGVLTTGNSFIVGSSASLSQPVIVTNTIPIMSNDFINLFFIIFLLFCF